MDKQPEDADGGMKLILAEDDVAMRRWLKTILSRAGASIREAASGWEVLSLLASGEAVDLVISDVRMPMPSGLQALAMARTAGSTTPFLLITAFGDDALKEQAATMRARVLDKPFSAADLLEHVRLMAGPQRSGG